MGRKGKTVVLVLFLSVILLALYRNFGVPVFRFWPLILADTVLRVPGDNLLKLLNPRVPAVIYEILRGLIQFATALSLWWGFGRLWFFVRVKPSNESFATPQAESPPARAKRIRKRWRTLAVSAAVGLLILIPSVGRQLVDLVSFLAGVYGYPLHVTTKVFVEGSEHKLGVFYFGLPESREILPSGDAGTPGAIEFQENLLLKCRKKAPLLRPGIILARQLPSGISLEEAKSVERRALDFLNAFSDLNWTYTAEAILVYSKDGTRATYRIETYSYNGPTAAIGFDYAVELVKVEGGWLVKRFGQTSLWIS